MTAITNMLSFQQERRELMNYLRKGCMLLMAGILAASGTFGTIQARAAEDPQIDGIEVSGKSTSGHEASLAVDGKCGDILSHSFVFLYGRLLSLHRSETGLGCITLRRSRSSIRPMIRTTIMRSMRQRPARNLTRSHIRMTIHWQTRMERPMP